ncbi:MAG: nucleotide pyrophosphohydrolase [Bacilli bacterium]|nr:nucleotide pyrophosphohydrolase [Bacilli bacterium]
MEKLEELKQRIDKFNKDRDWDQFHTPSNLAKSISIEASELLECFQWNDAEYDKQAVLEELADVMNYCIQMSLVLDVDIVDVINKKMDKTELKYPVDKAKGVSTKYDKLG